MRTDDDILRWIATAEESRPEVYPELYNLSAAFVFKFLPRPKQSAKPEFLYLPNNPKYRLELVSLFAQWNMAWEAGQLRNIKMFDRHTKTAKRLIPILTTIENQNVYLLPDTPKRLEA